MPLLTHERLKEELRLFARGALRAELRELGERVRREVSEELKTLVVEPSSPRTPVSILRTHHEGGGTRLGSHPRTPQHGGGGEGVCFGNSRTPTTELQHLLRSVGAKEPILRPDSGQADADDEPIMKSLKSYKVVDSHKQDIKAELEVKPFQGRRKSHNNLDVGHFAQAKAPGKDHPTSPAHMFLGLGSLMARQRSGDQGSSQPAIAQQRSKNRLEAPPGSTNSKALLRGMTSSAVATEGGQSSLDVAGVRRNRRAVSEEVPQVRVVALQSADSQWCGSSKVAPLELSDSESVQPPCDSPRKSEVGVNVVPPQHPTDNGPPKTSPPFIGIMPAPKLSWGATEQTVDEDSEAGSSRAPKVQDEACETPTASHSFFDESQDPFGGQMYFQRDQRRKGTVVSEAYSMTRTSTSTANLQRSGCYRLLEGVVENSWFNHFMALVIFANIVVVGMQTDYLAQHLQEKAPLGYSIAEAIFCAVFLFELLARLFVYRREFFYIPGWQWNIFDCFMVVLQLFEQALELAIAMGTMGEGGTSFSFGFLRALRILRVIRLLRAARIVEHVRELQTIVLSIGGSIKSLCWTLLLLILLIYVVAVSFTQLVLIHRMANPALPADHVFNTRYASLGASILTLYGAIMGGVDWISVADPLLHEIHPIMGIVFCFYVAFAVLAMMNVVTGVFVEASLKTARDHHEATLLSSAKNLFADADLDESGQVSWMEFQDRLDHPHMLEFFKSIDVDVSEADTVFHLLDFNEKGKIDVDQFMGGCLRLRGPAKAVDLAMLMHETRRMARRHGKQMTTLYRKIEGILSIFLTAESNGEPQVAEARSDDSDSSPTSTPHRKDGAEQLG